MFRKSGDSQESRNSLMLSVAGFWLVLNLFLSVAETTPVKYVLTSPLPRENHPTDNEDMNKVLNFEHNNQIQNPESFETMSTPDERKRLEGAPVRVEDRLDQFLAKPAQLTTGPIPAYFDPQVLYQELVYNKRRKRDLTRNPRKIASSPMPMMQMQMPAYYPFIMAEMIPGSVKTRHPSIIAVNGCPAYYIADHKGRCRQVFQYTVNFGQNAPKSQQPINSPLNRNSGRPFPQLNRASRPNPPTPSFVPRPISRYPSSPSSSASPRLLALLKNATKNFDLSFLKQKSHSNASGESGKDDGIDKLRQKILSALKITKSNDLSKKNKSSSSKGDKGAKEVESGTHDYDD